MRDWRFNPAAARVRAINQGRESVPTLGFPDSASLTEPSPQELKAGLEAMGYNVGLLALRSGSIWTILFWDVILYAALRLLEVSGRVS